MDTLQNNKESSVKEKLNRISGDKKQLSQENISEFSGRNLGQQTARTIETVLGYPGNLKKAAKQTSEFLQSFLPEEMKLKKPDYFEPTKGSLEEKLYNPPTSQDVREKGTKPLSKKIFGEENYLEPKNEYEKVAGELNQDITSFFLPGTRGLRLSTKLGAPIAGNLVKEGSKYLGTSEENAEKAKLGVMLMTTIANQSQPGQFASQRIGQAKQMIPETATVNAAPLAQRLMPLYTRLQRGLRVPSKSRTLQGMEDLANQVQNGRMNLRSLMEARDHINEWISEAGGWDVPRNTRDASVRNLNDLKRQIIDTINENMTNRFPEAGELYRTGYEAAAVTHESNFISNYLERNYGRKLASMGAKVAFPALAGGSLALPKLGVAAGIGAPIYQTGKVLYRIGNSPTLARYYHDTIRYSMIGNTPEMVKSLAKFDKEMLKEEKEEEKNKKPTLEEFKAKFKNKG